MDGWTDGWITRFYVPLNSISLISVLQNEMHHRDFVKFISTSINTVLVQFVPHG